MASPPQGVFDFPGVVSPISGKYLCGHGVQPGRIVLKAAYQNTPVLDVGNLRINYGGQYFDVRDCKVQEQINFYEANGWVTEYLLEDRRWRWRFGEIEGHYNRKLKSGKIDTDCEKTPQQLAYLLFQAMREQNYNFSALPNDPRPEVLWVGANPAQELERLCDVLGCRLVYDPFTDTVVIRRAGEGNFLPDLASVDQFGANLTKPAVPSAIRIVGAETRVQMALPLKPLALDTDGKLVDPDQLSYVQALASDTGRSETDWYYDESPEFDSIQDKGQRKLLKRSMWRYWTVDYSDASFMDSLGFYLRSGIGNPVAASGVGLGNNLRAEDVSMELNQEYRDDDGLKTKEGYVAGIFRVIERGQFFWGAGQPVGFHENTATAQSNVVYDGGVSVNNSNDFPVFITSDPIWKWEEDPDDADSWLKKIPDELFAVCTFTVRDHGTGSTCSKHHFNYFYQLTNDPNVGPEIIVEESLELRPYQDFNKGDLTRAGQIQDNRAADALLEKSETLVRNRARRYQVVEAGNANYQELVLAALDGAIQSIVWSFSENGATTEIYRNSEPDFVATKYDRRITDTEIARRAGVTLP